MFKKGDIIKLKADDYHYENDSELNRNVYTDDIIYQSFVITNSSINKYDKYEIQGMKNGNKYMLYGIESCDFKLDPVCLRKQKLEKLCLKQEIG